MSTQPTMTDILPRIEQSIERVVQAVTALPPAAREEPLLPGDRSVKDVLGHITWWDQWLLLTLPPAVGEPAPAITLPLADQIPPNDHWADEMNAKVLLYNKQREFAPIWEEFTATRAALVRRVSQLSAADLYDPAGMSATIGQPVAPLVCGIYEHYEEHAHEFESLQA
ncbi:MAG: DinB family protein [Caldilineaceae bacterium]